MLGQCLCRVTGQSLVSLWIKLEDGREPEDVSPKTTNCWNIEQVCIEGWRTKTRMWYGTASFLVERNRLIIYFSRHVGTLGPTGRGREARRNTVKHGLPVTGTGTLNYGWTSLLLLLLLLQQKLNLALAYAAPWLMDTTPLLSCNANMAALVRQHIPANYSCSSFTNENICQAWWIKAK